MQHTTATPRPSPLGDALLALLVDTRPAFRQQRTFYRAMALVVGFLHSLARHTVTQTLLAIGCVDADWSAFYRLFSHDRIHIDQLQQRLVAHAVAHVPPDQPLMLAVDAVAFPRSGRRMPGVSWRKAPGTAPFRFGLALAQRFGALHWLPPLTQGYTRAIPLLSYPLFTPSARPAQVPPQKEWEGALGALTTLRTALAQLGRSAQPLVLLGDGSYDVAAFWKALPAATTLLVRTARNRRLFHIPAPAPPRRGRRRKYGPPAPRPADWLQLRRGWTERTITVRGHARRVRYRLEGPFLRSDVAERPVFLVLLGGQSYHRRQQRRHREPVPVLVNAVQQADASWGLPLPVETIIVWLWQRWEVEVAHRELKSGFGVGEMQCWNAVSTVTTIQWGIWLYAICLLAAYRTWGICGGPQPPGRWRKAAGRWSFTTLWRELRRTPLPGTELTGVWTGRPGTWTKKEAWIAQMLRTVRMTARH